MSLEKKSQLGLKGIFLKKEINATVGVLKWLIRQ